MPKIINHAKMRLHIIDKAIPLFASGGYDSVNFTMISEACGIRRTSLYKYFNDKEDLFMRVIDHAFKILELAISPVLADNALGEWERIRQLCYSLLKSGLSERNSIVIILQTSFLMSRNKVFSEHIRAHANYIRDAFVSVLTKGIESGQIKKHDPKAMAFALVTIIEAFLIQDFLNAIDDALVMESLDLLLSGLCAHDPARDASS